MTHHPIAAVGAVTGLADATHIKGAVAPSSVKASSESFAKMLTGGIEHVNASLKGADAMAQAFVLNEDAVAPHQVAYALEQARMSVELMMQVRSQLVSGYQEIMRMQL